MIHYLYLLFNREKDFYIGRRSYKGSNLSKDSYMGSSKDKTFFPAEKRIIAFAGSLEELKRRERSLIIKFVSNPKCRNLAIPPIKDCWGTFKWITNGRKNIQIRDAEAIPEGFNFGRVNAFGGKHPTEGCKQWIKDGETKRSINCPGPGWKLGSYYDGRKNLNPKATIGMKWITDGIESKLVKNLKNLEEGWKLGRTVKKYN